MHASILRTFKSVLDQLPSKIQKECILILCGMFTIAIVEIATIGSMGLFVQVITNPYSEEVPTILGILFKYFLPNHYNNPSPQIKIMLVSVIFAILVLTKNILSSLLSYHIGKYSVEVEAYFGRKLFKTFLNRDYAWLIKQNKANLIYAVEWRSFFGRNFILPILTLLSDLAVFICMNIAAFYISAKIASISILAFGLMSTLFYRKIRKSLDARSLNCLEIAKRTNQDVSKALNGIKDVKVTQTEDFFFREFCENISHFPKAYGGQQCLTQLPKYLLETIGFLTLIAIVLFLILQEKVPMEMITSSVALVAVAAWRLLPAVNRILTSLTTARNSLPYIKKEIDYLYIDSKEIDTSKKKDVEISFHKELVLRDVSFAYTNSKKPVLDRLNLSIKKGDIVGLVGLSGAGKSTLVDVIMGLHKPVSGQIFLDDFLLEEESYSSWSKKIGYVSQSPYIFEGTLAENIAFGIEKKLIDREKVLDCAKKASINFIESLSDGIDTYLGNEGTLLSGGEKQRIAIARALYKDAQFLILDEATSALDSMCESSIMETIYSLTQKQTVVIIAHRLSSIEKCNKIAWLDSGSLREYDQPNKVLNSYKKELLRQRGKDV